MGRVDANPLQWSRRKLTAPFATALPAAATARAQSLASNAQASYPNEYEQSTIMDNIRSFVDPVAREIFFLAWPGSPFRSFSLSDPTSTPGGFDVSVKLDGTGINEQGGTDIWLELVIEIRNGRYQGFRLGRNNGSIQPFTDSADVDRVRKLLFEEYAADCKRLVFPY